jgi:hypothetical protein
MTRRTVLAVLTIVAAAGIGLAPPASAATAAGHQLPIADIFATSNTATITDPNDPRMRTTLGVFAAEVDGIIATNGGIPGRSTLLNGVFWSDDLHAATYERSREFDVYRLSAGSLHHIADLIAKQFHQESVLTFQYLPRAAADSIEVEVPGVTVTQLFNGLAADPTLREELGGGSVTVNGGRLTLIADSAELGAVQTFVGELGAAWSQATVNYGHLEFVS